MTDLREIARALGRAVEEWDEAGGVVPGPLTEPRHQAATSLRRAAAQAVAALISSWSVEDLCAVGDQDPTPHRLATADQCRATDPVDRLGYRCTRAGGHASRQHVAGTGARVAHVWPWRPADAAGGDRR